MISKIKLSSTKVMLSIIITFAVLGVVLYSLPVIKQRITAYNYYKALKDSNYDKAFNYLLLYDKYVSEPSKYSIEEAKFIYLNKMNSLNKANGYNIVKADIDTYIDDGIFYIEADLVAEVNGKIEKYTDLLKFKGDKFFIDASTDGYSKLRDGKLEE